VNGNPPKTVAVGETYQGVKLVSLQSEQAVVELEGKRVNLRMDTPVSIGGGGGSGGGGNRVVLSADSRGHFMTQGAINGRPVTFMLDTGATSIALSAADAQRIGLDYSKGQRVQMSTANGVRGPPAAAAVGARGRRRGLRHRRHRLASSPCPSCCWATASSTASPCAATRTRWSSKSGTELR
jgi:hypothetical protein